MKYHACVRVSSSDLSCRVDAETGSPPNEHARGCAGNVEAGDGAFGRAHEAVQQIARVHIGPRDSPCRVDADTDCPLKRPCSGGRAGSVEGSDGAVGSTLEAVPCTGRVRISPRDIPRCIDAQGCGPNQVLKRSPTGACVRNIEGSYPP